MFERSFIIYSFRINVYKTKLTVGKKKSTKSPNIFFLTTQQFLERKRFIKWIKIYDFFSDVSTQYQTALEVKTKHKTYSGYVID